MRSTLEMKLIDARKKLFDQAGAAKHAPTADARGAVVRSTPRGLALLAMACRARQSRATASTSGTWIDAVAFLGALALFAPPNYVSGGRPGKSDMA